MIEEFREVFDNDGVEDLGAGKAGDRFGSYLISNQ